MILFDPREIAIAIQREIAEETAETAVATTQAFVSAVPVGNPSLWENPRAAPRGYVGGHARRNVQVTLTPTNVEIDGTDPNGFQARSQASRVIARLLRRPRRVYIQLTVPYGNRLNNGHSTQAPAGFAERAIIVGARGRGGREFV